MNEKQLAYLNSCPPGERHEVTVNGVTYVKDRRSPSPGMMFSNDFVVGQRAPLIVHPPPPVTSLRGEPNYIISVIVKPAKSQRRDIEVTIGKMVHVMGMLSDHLHGEVIIDEIRNGFEHTPGFGPFDAGVFNSDENGIDPDDVGYRPMDLGVISQTCPLLIGFSRGPSFHPDDGFMKLSLVVYSPEPLETNEHIHEFKLNHEFLREFKESTRQRVSAANRNTEHAQVS